MNEHAFATKIKRFGC